MGLFQIHDTVANVVMRHPELSRIFEEMGIDYCCGGKKTLDEVSQKRGIDHRTLLSKLEDAVSAGDDVGVDVASMSLTELVDHIEKTHHNYLRFEFPRLDRLTGKVAAVHSDKEPRLHEIRKTFLVLFNELFHHMMKEEKILFPMIRQLETSTTEPTLNGGSLASPIRQMESEHDNVGSALERLRELTDGYTPPEWACNTFRATFNALAHLENDLHQHIHKENNILFPRALEMENVKAS